MIRYLTRQEIIEINRRMTLEFGGYFSLYNDNLANENSLEFVLDAPFTEVFGHKRYPEIL